MAQMIIWRPIMAQKTTLTEVRSGVCTLRELLALNALLDAEIAQQHAATQTK